MEELRDTALAYYDNLSTNQKNEVENFFNRMDVDGNGKVSKSEFMAFLPPQLSKEAADKLFQECDKDGNGTLEFNKVITFYYIFVTRRMVFCDGYGCGAFLKGVYFTCCQCFNRPGTGGFDLCCACYRKRNFTHHADAIFNDNFTLLMTQRLGQSLQNLVTPVIAQYKSNHQARTAAQLATASQVCQIGNNTLGIGMKVFDIAKQFFGNDDDGCSIM